jgi:hypothetical protein
MSLTTTEIIVIILVASAIVWILFRGLLDQMDTCAHQNYGTTKRIMSLEKEVQALRDRLDALARKEDSP